MKKQIGSLFLAAVMTAGVLSGCAGRSSVTKSGNTSSTSSANLSGKTLEVAVTYTGDQATEFKQVMNDFTSQYGCKVNIDEYGDDYESTLKTRMASNNLPDIFQTHGWSLLRYKDYLINLSDQSWASDYDKTALTAIEDSKKHIYVLMISELINGTLANLDACDKAGVDPYTIHTWDDFTQACQKLKDAGITPIASTPNAGLLANMAGTWVSYEGEQAQDSKALLNGTYNWESYKTMLQEITKWINAGYFFSDAQTLKDTDEIQRYAAGKAAFMVGNDPSIFVSALKLNSNAKFAFLPSFASKKDGKEFVGIGEGDAFGIWKGSKNTSAAKVMLNYLAQPKIALSINNVTGKISCLKSTQAVDNSYGLKVFDTMKQKCTNSNILYENLWDRQYTPNGMWSIFGNACGMLFASPNDTGIDKTVSYLKSNYKDLYETAHS